MFIIYTKEKKPKIKFTVNLTREEVKELMGNNLFLDYPDLDKNNFIIVEQENIFKYPILGNNGSIREMTRDELVANGIEVQLNEGEFIKDKKIIKIERPSKYHKWINNKWVVNLDEVKEQKRQELKKIRDTKVRDNISLYGVEFQVRNEIDIENFKDVERGLNKGFKQLTDKRFWILADNSIKEFTYEQLSKVLDEKAKRKEVIFHKFGLLSMELEKADTVEKIEAIKWE